MALGSRESNKKRTNQKIVKLLVTLKRAALLGEFFVDGLNEFVEVEGFLEDATGSKEFRNIEKVAVALRAGHSNDFRIEIIARQLQRGFETVCSWHQNVHEDQVYFVLLVESQTLLTIAGFEHTVVGSFKNLLQEVPDRFFVVDDEDRSHRVRGAPIVLNLTYIGFSCLERS